MEYQYKPFCSFTRIVTKVLTISLQSHVSLCSLSELFLPQKDKGV